MWIEPGKPVSLADLERGVVISSGNDASVAVAEHLAVQSRVLSSDESAGCRAGPGQYRLSKPTWLTAS